MNKQYSLILFLLLAAGLSAQSGRPLLTDDGLTGWKVYIAGRGEVAAGEQELFVWEDSLLHILPNAEAGSQQPFAALVTEKSYDRYRLHVEYKWGEKKFAPREGSVRDAGILFHTHDPSLFWPSALECQIQEGDTGDIWLVASRATSTLGGDARNFSPDGSPETRAGERYAKFARSYSRERPGWNVVEVEVDGPTARFFVNGHLVNALTDARKPGDAAGDWVPLTEGFIALQAEGAELYYRNVWIEEL